MFRYQRLEMLYKGFRAEKVITFKKSQPKNYNIIKLLAELQLSRIEPYIFYN